MKNLTTMVLGQDKRYCLKSIAYNEVFQFATSYPFSNENKRFTTLEIILDHWKKRSKRKFYDKKKEINNRIFAIFQTRVLLLGHPVACEDFLVPWYIE